jgi:Uma2 family endonuclease
MSVQIPLQRIQVPPGQRVLLRDVSWEEFEAILQVLGDRRSDRVAYCDGMLEIMSPSPEHEYFKETFGDAVKDMAESLELDYESYGSTTWRRQAEQAGLEPDNCFYFQNEARVRGKLQFDLNQYPPPRTCGFNQFSNPIHTMRTQVVHDDASTNPQVRH